MDEYSDEVEDLKKEVEHYKFTSESFERRVLDLQKELLMKNEEIQKLKEKFENGLARSCASTVSEEGDEPLNMRKLFIGGLPHDATDETLQEYFSKYGSVVNSSVVKDSVTKRSRGFGFVIFSSSKMADDAQAARPHCINGKEVDTKRAIPKSDMDSTYKNHSNIQEKRVFIGGLRGSTTSEILNTYFGSYGVVESVDLILDPNTHRNRGFAYIAFDDSDSAGKVILQKYHVIDGRKCEAKPAFQKQQRYPSHSHQMDGGYGAVGGSYGSYANNYMNYMDPCYQQHKSCCEHYHHHHHREEGTDTWSNNNPLNDAALISAWSKTKAYGNSESPSKDNGRPLKNSTVIHKPFKPY